MRRLYGRSFLHLLQLILLLPVLLYQLLVLPLQVLVHLLLLHVLLHQCAVLVPQLLYCFEQFQLLFVDGFRDDNLGGNLVVEGGVLFHLVDDLLQLLLFFKEGFFLLHSFGHFAVFLLKEAIEGGESVDFLLQPFVFSILLVAYLFPAELLEFFEGHVWRSFFLWPQQVLVEGLLVRYQPPLIEDFVFVVVEPFASDFGLFLFDLFGDEVVEPEAGAFVEEGLEVFEVALALMDDGDELFGAVFVVGFDGEGLEVDLGGVEEVLDLVVEHFKFVLELEGL